jgi:predicted transcriptional regulator
MFAKCFAVIGTELTMTENENFIALTVDVVSAFVAQNNIRADDVPGFITATHAAIAALGVVLADVAPTEVESKHTPMVSPQKSLSSKDHIVSMIDGKPYKTLKRHLSGHGLTPEQYRERYKLPATYPMVAESYSAARRDMAKRIGLGRKPGTKVAANKTTTGAASEKKAPSALRKARQHMAAAE